MLDWNALTAAQRAATLQRPSQPSSTKFPGAVGEIIADVHRRGDVALREFTARLDGALLDSFEVAEAEFAAADAALPVALKTAIAEAALRIEMFHLAGSAQALRVETAPGVICERLPRAIARVGLYVPAGSAPLPSTALMLGIPARLAGCREVILCTPPRKDGSVDAAVLNCARLCGVTRVFKLGGAQAIAAMAMGTQSVPACDKLFGPGNAWVTEAKRQVSAQTGGPAIDMPAGPSELLVIADAAANPAFVAADLLAQAEHGPDSQVFLLSDDDALIATVVEQIHLQLRDLPRAKTARQALANSRLIRVTSLVQAVEISNQYAPEHLIINVGDPRALLPLIENAGSVFLGAWSPESVGDYCSGTNHVLPTHGHARALSGLSVASFQKQITVQELSVEGLRGIGACAVTLAGAEGLHAHARAVTLRLAAQELPT
ncbi:MAG TPA: histidinol dehydrogenase [Rudaea sp.]|nr:histidinol dehydrogenase [Rudaea sp.]